MKRPDLTTLLIPFVYFIAGASSLAGVATTFFYKDELHLTLEQLGILGSVAIIPWSIKPIYGILSDRVPLRGLRRKPYLILSGFLGSIGYLSLATWVDGFWGVLIAELISALGFAMADVIVDGIVAERSSSHKAAGKLQSICRAAIMTGALVVAYSSGVLTESIGARRVFLLTATLPLFTSLIAIFLKELPMEIAAWDWRQTWANFKKALQPAILWSALFLFIWRSTPTSGGAFSYYLIDELHFDPEFFGTLAVISRFMGIAGVLIFRKWLILIPLKRLLFGIVIASIVLSLPSLGLIYGWYAVLGVSPKFFAMADTLISAPLTEIGFLPLLVLVARICPKGIEATVFAVLASIMNIGLAISDMGGAMLVHLFDVHQATSLVSDVAGDLPTIIPANYANLDKVLWIAILSSVLPLPLLPFLPETRAEEEIRERGIPSGIEAQIEGAPIA